MSLCLEVLEGFRPVAQLRRLTVPAAFEAVAGQLARPAARAGHPAVRDGVRSPTRLATGRIRVRATRFCEPREGAVEAVAVLARGGRTWALACRFEHRTPVAGTLDVPATWLCTNLQIV